MALKFMDDSLDQVAVESLAKHLYEAAAPVAPTWGQLGETTQRVWREKAKMNMAGIKNWWSCDPKEWK